MIILIEFIFHVLFLNFYWPTDVMRRCSSCSIGGGENYWKCLFRTLEYPNCTKLQCEPSTGAKTIVFQGKDPLLIFWLKFIDPNFRSRKIHLLCKKKTLISHSQEKVSYANRKVLRMQKDKSFDRRIWKTSPTVSRCKVINTCDNF